MNNTIISLGVFNGTGGPTKTISAFKDALNAELYSFCSPRDLSSGTLAISGANAVVSSGIPVLRHMRYVTKNAARFAEERFATSRIVSCHSFYRYHSLWVSRMSKKYSVPYWFVPHGILDPWVLEYGKLGKHLYWACGGVRFIDRASAVIFSTTRERDKALSLFDLPNCEVIPWPVDVVECVNREERRENVRRELGIPSEARVLIYFGRLHPMKRPLETIQAVAAAKNEHLHLIIIGNEQGVTLEDCAKEADMSGIKKRVHLVGPVYGDRKFDFLFAADSYISLSHRENFNHTAAESLSSGLPLILSPGNDLQADIEEAVCSWGLKDNDVKSASQAIDEFASKNANELAAMGARGKAWVCENLQFTTFQERIDGALERYGK